MRRVHTSVTLDRNESDLGHVEKTTSALVHIRAYDFLHVQLAVSAPLAKKVNTLDKTTVLGHGGLRTKNKNERPPTEITVKTKLFYMQ